MSNVTSVTISKKSTGKYFVSVCYKSFKKEKVKTGVDKDGNDISGSKWVLKYPETVVPCESDVEENTTQINNTYPISREENKLEIIESINEESIKFN